jgi:cytidylate kinase
MDRTSRSSAVSSHLVSVITFSSSFGSGGSTVARSVADRLGWNLHNRAIPLEVASRLSVSLEAALANDEAAESRLGRMFAKYSVQLASASAGNIPADVFVREESFKEHSESIIRGLATSSNCVIVGRAAAIVLGMSGATLHVRLDGSRPLRAVQAALALNISTEESTRRLLETDRARKLYVRHFYGADWTDPKLYHIVLDSTALRLETCTELILTAAADRFADVSTES